MWSSLFIVFAPDEARAATFVVDSVFDAPDNTPGNGDCEATVPASTVPGDSATTEACTLRAAIQEANEQGGADTIELPAGHYELNQVGANEDGAATGDLDITDDLSIEGEDANFSVVDAEELEFVPGVTEADQEPPDRVFHIHGGIDVEMSDMTIRGGTAGGAPGAGDGTEIGCEDEFNGAPLECNGGGIYVQDSNASLTISDGILRDNFARGGGDEGEGNGGAIFIRPDTEDVNLTIEDSVVRENRALPGTGGAIYLGDQSVGGEVGGEQAGAFTMSGTLVELNRGLGGAEPGDNDDRPPGAAVRIGGNWTAEITDSSIFRNRVTPGLFIGEASDATVLRTEVAQNHGGGIVSNADGVDLEVADGSQVTANLHNGIELHGEDSSLQVTNSTIGDEVAAVRGHAFIGNQGSGIVMTGAGSDLNVTNSLVTHNHRSGIEIGGEGGGATLTAEILSTEISEQGAAGMNIGSDTETTIADTDVIHNTVGGIWVKPFTDEIQGDRNNQVVMIEDSRINRNNVRGLWVVENDVNPGSEEGIGSDDPVGAQLDITNSTFNRNNVAGIHVMDQGAVLNLTDSTVNFNRHDYGGGIVLGTQDDPVGAPDEGGEVVQDNVTATIDGSTIAHNLAEEQGGGIWNDGHLTIVNSTISANTAEDTNDDGQCPGAQCDNEEFGDGGGGLFNDEGGTVLMEYVTMFRNQTLFEDREGGGTRAFSDGEAIFNDGNGVITGTIEVFASIVALEITTTQVTDNVAGRENCGGEDPTSGGNNLEDMDTCSFDAPGDQTNTDPDLYALRDNGGPTETHMPERDSPARDTHDDCRQPVDQRDEPRPDDGLCDTGSVEVQGTENLPTPCTVELCVNNEYDHAPDGNCDSAPADPSPEDPGVGCTLREAVIAANQAANTDTIFVPSEDYFLTLEGANENDSLTGDLDITDTVTIFGEEDGPQESVVDALHLEFLTETADPGSCGDGECDFGGDLPGDRVLHVVTGTADVELEDLTLQHGRATGTDEISCGDAFPDVEDPPLDCRGGGILVERADSDLALNRVWVLENRTGNRGVEGGDNDGGGIYYEGGPDSTMTIEASRVSANQAGDDGNGGGIAVPGDEADVDIASSEIGGEPWGTFGGRFSDGNSAGDNGDGGGIWLDGVGATLDVTDTAFMRNHSSEDGRGGGIFVGGSDSVVDLAGSPLIENEGGDSAGGGLFVGGSGTSVALSDGSDVVGNTAEGNGGGINISASNVDLLLSGLELRGNQASGVAGGANDGGAIYVGRVGGVSIELTDTMVVRNKADNQGGAIYLDPGGTLDVTGVTFEDNNADTGGGAVFSEGTVALTDTAFLNNKSGDQGTGGGAIANDGGLLQVIGAEFSGNKADDDGGAILNEGDMTLREVEFFDNLSESDGGAVDNEDDASLEDVWFSYNMAEDDGGAWFNDEGADVDVDIDDDANTGGVTFSDNRAGEAIDEGPTDVDAAGAEHTGRPARSEQHPRDLNRGGHGHPEEANGPPEGEGGPPEGKGSGGEGSGGGFYNEDAGDVHLVNTTFSRNEDADQGGGIYNAGDMVLEFSTLYDHETDLEERNAGGMQPGDGVAIFNDFGQIDVTATIVANSEGENCQDNSLDTITSHGFNISDQNTCNFSESSDEFDTDPKVHELRDNGGFTPTHEPRDGISPAIDNVPSPGVCPPPVFDQRDFDRPFGPDCDTGAVESGTPPEEEPDGDGGAGPQPELDVSPEDANNTLPGDDSHTLEADVEDDEGDPVDFKIVSGPNAQGGDTPDFSCDPAGPDDTCEVTYTSDGTTGTDEICGWVDSDDDNVFNPGGNDADGGDCADEELGEEEGNDETDVVEKGWSEASPSPGPAASCNGQPATHAGTPGPDTIVGTNGDDVIQAFAGNDTIRGRGGDDIICAGAGNDNDASGGRGNDLILLGTGNDLGLGNSGNDRIRGEAGDDRARGGSGNDIIRGGRGDDTLGGNRGADRIFGGGDDDLLKGRAGRDLLAGRAGSDTLRGGANADIMRGNQGADLIQGGGGNDLANGRRGFDTVEGGNGRDRLRGGRQADVIRGQAGNDRLRGDEGDDTLRGGTGNDDLKGLDGDDLLNGGPNFDTCGGGPGADTIINCEA